MKLKRCFKTVLSSVLAAAMLITAVPSNLTLDVQAAPAVEEVTTEETAVAAEEITATEAVETIVEEESAVALAAVDPSTGYWGPTIDYNPDSETAGAVTIYYYPANFAGGSLESVMVKGSWVTDWDTDRRVMEYNEDGYYAYTLPLTDVPRTMSINYGFVPNSVSEWDEDDENVNSKGNSAIMRNPQIDSDSNVSLYYYPAHGTYPTSVKVQYRVAGSTDAYTEVEMATGEDYQYSSIYSVTLSNLADGDYEYQFDVDGTTVQDTNNAETGKFSVVSYPAADPNVVSPEINGKDVVFHYYGPTATAACVAGTLPDAAWGTTEAYTMTYDSTTGYWSTATKTLSAGVYEYKFIVNGGDWITDPLNSKTANNGNNLCIVPGLVDATAEVDRGKSVELPETLTCYDAEGTESSAAVTYTLADGSVAWASEVSLTEANGVTTLATTAALPAEVKTFALTATDGNNTSTVTVSVKDDTDIKSPVVNGNSITFNFYGPDYASVGVVGTLPGADWAITEAYAMTLDEATGYWTLTKDNISPGAYEYKFLALDDAGAQHWNADPLNLTNGDSEANSKVVVAGLADATAEVVRGKSVELEKTLKCYGATGVATDAAVTYALADEALADKVTLEKDEAGVTTLSVAADLASDVTTFDLVATAGEYTSTVTVTIVDKVYEYTIYYHDPDNTKDTAALWVWQTNGAGATAPTYFTEEVELEDGKTWMKAVVKASYTDISIIPRDYDSWDWQDATRAYVNEEEAEKVSLYIVKDDGTKIYTELPEIKEVEKRYLVVEYTRTSSTPENWYFYTWNSGYGSNVFVPFEEEDGKWVAKVPVKAGLDTISYCIERATVDGSTVTHWAEKDGNDYNCAVPADQTVVKIQMTEGQGITYTYPYNKGYEFDVENGKIKFFYRNDEDFLAGSTSSYAAAKVEVNGAVYGMSWDADEQRYEYDMAGLTPDTYKYRYILSAAEDISVTDKFNPNTVIENDIEYSVCEYDLFDVDVTAKMHKASMDYNDNNVLSVTFAGKDGADVSGMKAAKAYADLSALGGSSEAAIDVALMELSVAVKENVAAGTKTIPVTVFDQYGNKYTAETSVEVVNRNKGNDFDWDEAVIYFTVTDRFFDGNKNNNGDGYDTSENGGSSYHGGDFAGLTKKLDYLKDLGVNTIWITPIVENEMEDGLQTDVAGIKSWGYHGYWASDFTKLDSHLGTEKEFKKLLNEAHKRGMKIMVDVVLNHSGYEQEDYFNNILKDVSGNSVPMIRTADEMITGDDQKSSLSGLPDFLTENEEVRNLLVEWQSNWISKYDIDYYRVDTVKHVDDTTWSAFKNALTKIDPDFKMIGEWAGAGYGTDTGMLNEGRMDSLLDFDFNGEATKFVNGQIAEVEGFMNARNAAIDNTASLGAFIGSHDENGFAYALMNPEDANAVPMTEERAMDLTKVAASLQITAKGQVVIYYGEEIGMTGANNYPYQTNRYDFDWTAVNAENDTLTHYKKMLDIREKYSEVFAKGSRTTIAASNELGYDVFAKSYNGETVYTALNIGEEAVTCTIPGFEAGEFVTDIYSEILYQADANGELTITIPAASEGGTAVLVQRAAEETLYVTCVDTKVYAGAKTTLTSDELRVFYGNTELTAGKDYKVTYKNNTKVGEATVTVIGKGNFAGKETVKFNIVAKDVADGVTVNYQDNMITTGKKLNPLSSVVYAGKKLTNKDYSVEYFEVVTVSENTVSVNSVSQNVVTVSENKVDSVKAAGDYKVVISGKGNFTGEVAKEFTVHAKEEAVYLNKTNITLEYTSVAYDGTAKAPKVTVKLKDAAKTELTEGTHYTVTYNDNVISVGKKTVTITGVAENGYIGTVTKNYNIVANATNTLSKVAKVDTTNWQANVPYDVSEGKAIQSVSENDGVVSNLVTLTAKKADSGLTFTENVDYVVSYAKNDKPGTATMIFTGIGKYTGVVKKNFTIDKATITLADVTVADSAKYLKSGAKADVTVVVDGITLTAGTDYKVTYKYNTAVTTDTTKNQPCVIVKGIGKFKGTVKGDEKLQFTVVKESFENGVTVTASDVAFKDKAGKFMATPVVKDLAGKKVPAKEYTTKYEIVSGNAIAPEYIEVGKTDTVSANNVIRVTVSAKEDSKNFEGSNYAEYEVETYLINSAKVTVDAQVYTGKEITLTNDDITIKVGKEKLTLGEDYVINSYNKNVDKGTASVTLVGIGNYGGEKTVNFKITSRTVAWWWNLLH